MSKSIQNSSIWNSKPTKLAILVPTPKVEFRPTCTSPDVAANPKTTLILPILTSVPVAGTVPMIYFF